MEEPCQSENVINVAIHIEENVYPDTWPSCKERCEDVDVTCYLPECGSTTSGNTNPQVFKESSRSDERTI